MAKAPTEIRSLARAHTETAIRTLAGIMRQNKAPAAARVAAAQALLDRGWGKPAQPQTGADGEGPISLVYEWRKPSESTAAMSPVQSSSHTMNGHNGSASGSPIEEPAKPSPTSRN